eukprot:1068310-Rhodomonas_salina.1
MVRQSECPTTSGTRFSARHMTTCVLTCTLMSTGGGLMSEFPPVPAGSVMADLASKPPYVSASFFSSESFLRVSSVTSCKTTRHSNESLFPMASRSGLVGDRRTACGCRGGRVDEMRGAQRAGLETQQVGQHTGVC